MSVKGGVAYIDFKQTEISSAGSFVLDGIYSYFNNAYNSRKVAVLVNLTYAGASLPDVLTLGIRKTSNSGFIVAIRVSSITAGSVVSRTISVSNDDTVTITAV